MSQATHSWPKRLVHNGTVVLEGVAGTGKTHAIQTARQYIAYRFLAPKLLLHLRALWTLENKTLSEIRQALQSQPFESFTHALAAPFDATFNLTAKGQSFLGNISDSSFRNWLAACPAATTFADYLAWFGCLAIAPTLTRVHVTVMHPSASYEDFIGGLRPINVSSKATRATTAKAARAASAAGGSAQKASPLKFKWTPGVFLQQLTKARPAWTATLFVMDEINRCNLPSVLGETLFLIEPSRRVAHPAPLKKKLLESQHAIRVGAAHIAYIPHNFFILGTMNSSDRSILSMDQAIRRRFPPFRIWPMTLPKLKEWAERNVLTHMLPSLKDARVAITGGTYRSADLLTITLYAWSTLNYIMLQRIGPDAMIGHSYLMDALRIPKLVRSVASDECHSQIAAAWKYGILPQVILAAETARDEELPQLLFAPTGETDLEILPEPPDTEEADHVLNQAMAFNHSLVPCGLEEFRVAFDEEPSKPEEAKEWREKVSKTLTTRTSELFTCWFGQEATFVRQHEIGLLGRSHGQRLVISRLPS